MEDSLQDHVAFRRKGLIWSGVEKNAQHIIFQAIVEGEAWNVRLNDFPDEPLYTLIIDDKEVVHFDNWPQDWKKPSL